MREIGPGRQPVTHLRFLPTTVAPEFPVSATPLCARVLAIVSAPARGSRSYVEQYLFVLVNRGGHTRHSPLR